jgi:ADP-ribose pyrophosphatase YjhB (NUDIX family)
MSRRFNVRVYGICIRQGMLLISEEFIRGQWIVKFPGGGLEWGEGLHDCLRREWQEEMRLEIEVGEHFYTTHFFQPSAFDDSQVLSVYYRVSFNALHEPGSQNKDERVRWVPLSDVSEALFSLPIDKLVGDMLRQTYTR